MSLTNSVLKETELPGRIGVLSPHASLTAGKVLQNRYRIVKQLGKGGMGAVYEAVDERLEATVALKETLSADVRLRRQFQQEACLLAQLSHPALPRVSDYFIEDDRAFLVMQFIAGVDLAEIIAKQPGPFPRHQVVAWADQLLDALIFLHTRERQIIHRDIKPHNLKLTASGAIALLDFGLAKAQVSDLTARDNSIYGYTRRYAPLEQIQDQGTSPQSDIYALGATLYHLLTGTKPADAVVRAAALANALPDPLRPANEVHDAVGPELAEILGRAMAQNPSDRYASANEFREALAQLGRDKERVFEQSMSVRQSPQGDNRKPVAERVRVTDPFESYSILKPDEREWFITRSRNRFNVVALGILLFLLIGLIGALYGYRHWAQALPPRDLRTNPDRHPVSAASQNRARLNPPNSAGVTPAQETNREVIGEGGQANGNSQEHRAFQFEGPGLQSSVSQERRERRIVFAPLVNAPSMRLPHADLAEKDPAPSFSRLPTFDQPAQVVERQVLRSPDGTQVVKYSDGTTRVFRPGEKAKEKEVISSQ